MSLLQVATIEQAAAKVGIFGPQGSGKTLTAMLIAIGLSKTYHNNAPVAMMDTETGSDFLVDVAAAENVPFVRFKSRAFRDMRAGIKEAEQTGACVYLVDSYTHPWTELNDALKSKKRVAKLGFQHMDELKSLWRTWTDLMLNSPLHVILSGRLGYVWDKLEDPDTGRKDDLVKMGVKLKGEGEAGYEPSLLVEMEALQDEVVRSRASRTKKGSFVHHAYVLKDRWRTLNGRTLSFKDLNDYKPGDYTKVFEAFRPHFAKLAINQGVTQRAVTPERNSESLFDERGDAASVQRARRATIACEEIEGLMTALWPGQDAIQKEMKRAVILALFQTRSWTRIQGMAVEVLDEQLLVLRLFEEATKEGPHGAALTDPGMATSLIAVCQQRVKDEVAQAEATVGIL